MTDKVILYKIALAFFLILISILVYKVLLKYKISDKNFIRMNLGILLFTRLFFFILIFLVINISPQSDVAGYYYPQAKSILEGKLPYLDFDSSYSFFFHYLYSLPLILWDSPKSLILTAIIIEIAAFFIWHRVLELSFNYKTANEIAFIYLLNPIPFFNVVINGQNQILLALFLGIVVLLQLKNRDGWSGFIFGVGLMFTKFLFLIFVPIVFLVSERKIKFLLFFSLSGILPFLLLAVSQIDIFIPLKVESSSYSSGNFFYLLTAVFPDIINRDIVPNLVLILIYLGSIALIYMKFFKNEEEVWKKTRLLIFTSVVFLLFMIFSKKSYATYLTIIFFPFISFIAFSGLKLKTLILFNVFGLISVLEPSLWFRLMDNLTLSFILTGSYNYITIGFLILEVMLLAFYFYYTGENYIVLNKKFEPLETSFHKINY